MKYDDQTLLNLLAAEYVLGILHGHARDRFSRLMRTSPRARYATSLWQRHIKNLENAIESNPPDQQVWDKITKRIDPIFLPTQKKAKDPNYGIFKAWGAIATAVCIVLVLITWQPQESFSDKVTHSVTFYDSSNKPLWSLDISDHSILLKAASDMSFQTDNDYQLWIRLKGYPSAIPIALLPKTDSKEIARNALFKPQNIALLAISREPIGGSQSGSPSEILYTAELNVN
ncbi:anti-sigma factor [Pseudoalteromonas gelatinilytica]|uniref:anti-sigma factor n=1 Tax=Pseudoalteromonas gelatinilytica TaxID=1703256 RepID=UPI0007C50B8C|nr:anti-sigma factor [Pseudoalteromonas gelatinilytica]